MPQAPDVRAATWRQYAAMPWAAFRRLPWWGQVIGWVLGFWILPAAWVLARATGPVGVTGAVAAAVIGVFIIAPALGGSDGTPDAAPSEANALLQLPSPTPAVTPAPSPSPSAALTSTPVPIPPSPNPTRTPSRSSTPAAAATSAAPSPTQQAVTGLPADGERTTVERIVDGDTLYLAGLPERARLIGIDTPETVAPNTPVECFGPEATDHLTELVPPGTKVVITRDVEEIDQYDRPLVYLYRAEDGLFVNEAMLADGYAQLLTHPPNVAHVDTFRQAQRDAREAGHGLWSADCDVDDQATVVAPETTEPSTGGGGVVIARIEYDGPGGDVEYNDSEYVLLRNDGDSAVDVGGWSLTDEKDHVITIPGGYSIPAGGELNVHTGPGDNTDSAYHDGQGQAIWNNSGGDTAILRDAAGTVVDQSSYSS